MVKVLSSASKTSSRVIEAQPTNEKEVKAFAGEIAHNLRQLDPEPYEDEANDHDKIGEGIVNDLLASARESDSKDDDDDSDASDNKRE